MAGKKVREPEMLQIRPNCENCDKDLPVDSTEACICSYECTFCRPCVEEVLENVCPNCGGGFVARPVRPNTAYREGVSRQHQPVSGSRVLKPVDANAHAQYAESIRTISPEKR